MSKSDDIRIANVKLDEVRFHQHNVRRDLGDLRSLTASIRRFGVMQPIVVDNRGDHWRLRAGHRRVAAARLAGLVKVPAVIHSVELDEEEWLIHAVQENVMRRGLDGTERADAVTALRDLGCSWEGIAEAFDVSVRTAQSWGKRPDDTTQAQDDREALKRKVADLTKAGRSAAQIADSLNLSQRTVVRLRTGNAGFTHKVRVEPSQLVTFTEKWRGHPSASVADVLDALDRLAETGRVGDALPTRMDVAS